MCERHRLSPVVRALFATTPEPAPLLPTPAQTTSSAATPSRRRRRLWELERKHLCSLVGSCLSLAELRRLARQGGFRGERFDAYRLYVEAVSLAGTCNAVAQRMQAMLERKYAAWVKRFASLTTDAQLLESWREHFARGEVAGAMWAALTHPAASEQTQNRIYADVHMLSHQLGAGQMEALRRLARLEQDHAQVTARLAEQSRRHTEAMAEARARQQALEEDNRRLRAALHDMEGVKERLQRYESGQVIVDMGRRLLMLEAANADLRLKAGRSEALEQELRSLNAELLRLRQERDTAVSERDALERIYLSDGASLGTCTGDCAQCSNPLSGRCVLYVGGRTALLAHYRKLAERLGIRLIHHDGGREDAMSRLPELLGASDAVICPTDSISHAAYGQLKRHCKANRKPCVLARTSGIAGFAAALTQLAGGQADPRTQFLQLDSQP